MNIDVIKKLKNAGCLSDQVLDLGYVSTGSYALNEVITGDFTKGIPFGGITQFKGDSSTAKTVFLSNVLAQAQKEGYYTIIDDAENAYSTEFAKINNVNPDELIYTNSTCLEEAFDNMEKTILAIREIDKDTPIVAGIDSLPVLPSRKELEADDYDQSPVDGALRAKITGGCLRKINGLLRKNKVALIIINQLREKINVMYGNPETKAAGGRALDFYLAVDLKTVSSKAKATDKNPYGLIQNESKDIIGIRGKIVNKKNKVGVPFKECDFQLFFNKGLDPYYGLVPSLIRKGLITVPSQGWCQIGETKFRKREFLELLSDKTVTDFDDLRNIFGITVDKSVGMV